MIKMPEIRIHEGGFYRPGASLQGIRALLAEYLFFQGEHRAARFEVAG